MARQQKLNTPEKRARVGERIKVAATQAGLSLKELAERAGVPPSSIYQYVRGITAVPVSLLESIAIVTRVHASFFDPEQDARQTLALPMNAPYVEEAVAHTRIESSTRSRIEAEMRQARALADASRGVRPNRAAYLSALEQMLALAHALDMGDQHAHVLAQLGRARLEDGDLSAAASCLAEARGLLANGPPEARGQVILDLVQCLMEREEPGEALRCLEEIVAMEASPDRWRAEILLGRIHVRNGDFPVAMLHYGQAAEAVLARNSPQIERDAQVPLASALAGLAYGIGRFSASRTLWRYVARRAEGDQNAACYLEATTELARCAEALGDLATARLCLEKVIALASFLPDGEYRQATARGLLARIHAWGGARVDSTENARQALRIAHRNGKIADRIAANIAMAQIRLAADQYSEALEYANEAADQARRAHRSADLATALLICAASCQGTRPARRKEDGPSASGGFRRALTEARAAAEAANRGRDLSIWLHAQWIMASVYANMGEDLDTEGALSTLFDALDAGLVGPKALLNTCTDSLITLLLPEIDLQALFHPSARLELPLVEWQAHTMRGVLAAGRQDADAAYSSFLAAATIVWRVICELTPADAFAFYKRNPRLSTLLEGLERSAIATGRQAHVRTLIERIQVLTEQRDTAVVGVEATVAT